LPDAEYLSELDEKELEETLNKLEDKGLIRIPLSELQPQFGDHLRHDIALLKGIEEDWSDNTNDPKFEFFKQKITTSLSENSNRKIVVFTEFSDTANYVFQKLQKDGFARVFKYSSEDASDENKKIIRSNFDAGLEEAKQSNDFDIIIATDAISEGFNLHRAGAIINYDIPYNPTRVIQRVGRINRINRKVFDELYIYNFFPTLTGELETRTKAISTLKMDLIHTLLGEDTKTLTSEEDLKNYFAKQYKEENSKNESLSWDAPYRNTWLKIKDDKKIMDQISRIPHRSRIARNTKDINGVVAFAKKSGNYVFAFGNTPETVQIVSPQVALPLFNQVIDSEESLQTTVNFDPIYKMAKEHIFKDNTKASVDDGREDRRIGPQCMELVNHVFRSRVHRKPIGDDCCAHVTIVSRGRKEQKARRFFLLSMLQSCPDAPHDSFAFAARNEPFRQRKHAILCRPSSQTTRGTATRANCESLPSALGENRARGRRGISFMDHHCGDRERRRWFLRRAFFSFSFRAENHDPQNGCARGYRGSAAGAYLALPSSIVSRDVGAN
jgi:hypothetical protein